MFNWLAFSFKREAIHSNFIVWFTRPMFEPTIYYTQSMHAYYYTTDARTHDLLHSKWARLLLHHRCSNPRSTTLKVSTVTITPPMRYSTMCINFFKVRFMFSISLKASIHLSSCIQSVFLANSFCQNKTYKKGTGYEYDGYVFVAWVLQVRRAEVVTNDQPVSGHGPIFYGN